MNYDSTIVRRFIVCDEEGPIRKFYSRADAKRFMASRPELKLVVEDKPKLDTSTWEEAPF